MGIRRGGKGQSRLSDECVLNAHHWTAPFLSEGGYMGISDYWPSPPAVLGATDVAYTMGRGDSERRAEPIYTRFTLYTL